MSRGYRNRPKVLSRRALESQHFVRHNKNVVSDPARAFGQPTIKGRSLLASTLFGHFIAGDSIRFIACVYEVPKEAVKDAIRYGLKSPPQPMRLRRTSEEKVRF